MTQVLALHLAIFQKSLTALIASVQQPVKMLAALFDYCSATFIALL
ncbi:MAG: hypothetical protein KME05_21825 [Gloeocapsa sp. UFS-A4-WI-NPMV-4B04]|nr:hypothetical protein [Gloeocapsa sp. UFS-A4-WI-NPMV-4B04]